MENNQPKTNVFSRVKYVNPVFKPVDYDFHGFSEGPMSPPSHNLFELVSGFALMMLLDVMLG